MENWKRVVVTGMGAITPVGKSVEETWLNLVNGVNGIDEITFFDTTDYKAKLDGEVKDFNPRDYMEKSDVLKTDRFSQFALVAAEEAIKQSGIMGNVDPDRFAVYFGSGIGGMGSFVKEHNTLLKRGPSRVSPFFVPMMIANMASGLISIKFQAMGQAMPSVTACASGSNAIGEAMRLIRHGYADAVITGGSEAAICEIGVAGFVNMQALSTATDKNAASLPFDKRRGGFVIAEGGGALVLEEYEHAIKRGAPIFAELVGYGATSDAYHMTAQRSDAEGARKSMAQALKEAGYTESDSVYINAHGTGTPMNDKCETLAIKKSLGEEAARRAIISSTKSMTGHMLGAAGAVEAIASIKALCTGIIPPTINLLEQDEECDLYYTPNTAVNRDITLALSNSLGFGGHNATLAFRRI